MQLGNLGSHLSTQLGVQVGKGLVQQEHLGVTDDGAAQGNTLTLTTGQSLGLAVQQVGDVQDAGSLFHAALDFVLGVLRSFSRKPCYRTRSCEDTERSSGTPWRCRGPWSDVVRQHVADVQLALADFFRPAIIRRVVDLPQPEGPTRMMNSLSAMSRLKSVTAVTPPE